MGRKILFLRIQDEFYLAQRTNSNTTVKILEEKGIMWKTILCWKI